MSLVLHYGSQVFDLGTEQSATAVAQQLEEPVEGSPGWCCVATVDGTVWLRRAADVPVVIEVIDDESARPLPLALVHDRDAPAVPGHHS